jgi:alpha/beta superfamily hydrolase
VDVIEGRAVRIESAGPALEGLLHLPSGQPPFPGIVICHPHPQFGGEMHNNVVGALVRAALGCGVAALRFNFRGVGASEGSYDGGAGERDDARAALDFLRSQAEIDASRVALAGYSFGANVAIAVADRRDDLSALISVSAPTQRGPKVEVRLLCPALFVMGDRDQYGDSELLLEYREQLGDDVTVEVLPGVDHFWWGSDGRLIEIVSGFLREHMMVEEVR